MWVIGLITVWGNILDTIFKIYLFIFALEQQGFQFSIMQPTQAIMYLSQITLSFSVFQTVCGYWCYTLLAMKAGKTI